MLVCCELCVYRVGVPVDGWCVMIGVNVNVTVNNLLTISKSDFDNCGEPGPHAVFSDFGVVRRLFGGGMVDAFVLQGVPLFLSFLAMPGLFYFLRVTLMAVQAGRTVARKLHLRYL